MSGAQPDCGTYAIPEAAAVLGISETLAYEIAKTSDELVPGVPIIRIRSLLKVSRYALDRFLRAEPQPVEAPAENVAA